jgi:hypoxanthine phosphoribosyltransferase
VTELGAELAADYEALDPILVAPLKGSLFFAVDLSRALPIVHELDFVELAGYGGAAPGGHEHVRLLKDLNAPIEGRHVVVVEDVVDTGLTLNYLRKLLEFRSPASLAVATLLDRPYRRIAHDLPVRYVGFVVPDEYFVGYGFDLDERYRNLPELRVARFRQA